MHRVMAISLACLCVAAAPSAAQSPYVHATRQEIKALSSAEIDDLRLGRGMGLARPAELNGYPGPMHTLEMASQLDLTAEQRAATAAIIARMREAAVALGAQIIDAERDFERALADRTIDPPNLRERTAEIAALHGRLRAVHLVAHLDQRAVLTPEQTQRYMMLLGYADPSSHQHPK